MWKKDWKKQQEKNMKELQKIIEYWNQPVKERIKKIWKNV